MTNLVLDIRCKSIKRGISRIRYILRKLQDSKSSISILKPNDIYCNNVPKLISISNKFETLNFSRVAFQSKTNKPHETTNYRTKSINAVKL